METAEPSLRLKVSPVDAARFPYSRYAVPISELCKSAQIADGELLQFDFPTYVRVGRLASTVIERADEVASFPAGEHDDYVDSVSLALMRFRKGGFIRTTLDEEDEPRQFRRRKVEGYY